MATPRSVLLVGFGPSVVDYSKWPALTPEKLRAMLEADRVRLNELGYHAESCFVDLGATAEAQLVKTLEAVPYDCVLIGAGVRTSEDHFILFEKLLNVVHATAPSARICFNTSPTDTAAAVQRWL
jgi:hypothetical protein